MPSIINNLKVRIFKEMFYFEVYKFIEDQVQETNVLKMLLDDFFLYKIAPNSQKDCRTVCCNLRKQINLCICQLLSFLLKAKSFVYVNTLYERVRVFIHSMNSTY